MDPGMILGNQSGNGDPDAEEFRAVDLMIVQKSFQQRRQRRGFFRERGDKIKRNHLIGEFMQAKIGQNQAQAVLADGDSDCKPRIGNNVETLRFAPAGGFLFAGILYHISSFRF